MNPSTSGWIDKFYSQISKRNIPFESYEDLYIGLKANGFIYGVNVEIITAIEKTHTYSEDELAKINLLTALYHIYYFHKPKFSNK